MNESNKVLLTEYRRRYVENIKKTPVKEEQKQRNGRKWTVDVTILVDDYLDCWVITKFPGSFGNCARPKQRHQDTK
jgi:hypothetical protein